MHRIVIIVASLAIIITACAASPPLSPGNGYPGQWFPCSFLPNVVRTDNKQCPDARSYAASPLPVATAGNLGGSIGGTGNVARNDQMVLPNVYSGYHFYYFGSNATGPAVLDWNYVTNSLNTTLTAISLPTGISSCNGVAHNVGAGSALIVPNQAKPYIVWFYCNDTASVNLTNGQVGAGWGTGDTFGATPMIIGYQIGGGTADVDFTALGSNSYAPSAGISEIATATQFINLNFTQMGNQVVLYGGQCRLGFHVAREVPNGGPCIGGGIWPVFDTAGNLIHLYQDYSADGSTVQQYDILSNGTLPGLGVMYPTVGQRTNEVGVVGVALDPSSSATMTLNLPNGTSCGSSLSYTWSGTTTGTGSTDRDNIITGFNNNSTTKSCFQAIAIANNTTAGNQISTNQTTLHCNGTGGGAPNSIFCLMVYATGANGVVWGMTSSFSESTTGAFGTTAYYADGVGAGNQRGDPSGPTVMGFDYGLGFIPRRNKYYYLYAVSNPQVVSFTSQGADAYIASYDLFVSPGMSPNHTLPISDIVNAQTNTANEFISPATDHPTSMVKVGAGANPPCTTSCSNEVNVYQTIGGSAVPNPYAILDPASPPTGWCGFKFNFDVTSFPNDSNAWKSWPALSGSDLPFDVDASGRYYFAFVGCDTTATTFYTLWLAMVDPTNLTAAGHATTTLVAVQRNVGNSSSGGNAYYSNGQLSVSGNGQNFALYEETADGGNMTSNGCLHASCIMQFTASAPSGLTNSTSFTATNVTPSSWIAGSNIQAGNASTNPIDPNNTQLPFFSTVPGDPNGTARYQAVTFLHN